MGVITARILHLVAASCDQSVGEHWLMCDWHQKLMGQDVCKKKSQLLQRAGVAKIVVRTLVCFSTSCTA